MANGKSVFHMPSLDSSRAAAEVLGNDFPAVEPNRCGDESGRLRTHGHLMQMANAAAGNSINGSIEADPEHTRVGQPSTLTKESSDGW